MSAPWRLLAVGGLVVVAVVLRWPALAPDALWLDDAWVALVSRADGPGEFAKVMLTAPGFTALVWAATAVGGASPLVAQLPALAAGLAAVPLTWVVVRRIGVGGPAAFLATALVAVAPAHVVYSTRVKQYTWDVLGALALVLLAHRVTEQPDRPARWWALAAGSAAALLLSATLAFVVAGAWASAFVGLRRQRDGDLRPALLAAATAAGFAAAYWWAVMRPIPAGVRDYWAARYLPLDDPALAVERLVDGSRIVVEALLPLPAPVGAVAVVVVLAVATIRRPALGIGALTTVVLAVAAAAAGRAPWGSGRTELFLLAPLAVAAAATFDRPAMSWRWWPAVPVVAGGALLVAGAVGPPVEYPAYEVRRYVAEADGADAAVLVYPTTRWAYGLYTDADVDLVDDPADPWGFRPAVGAPNVTILPVAGVFDPQAYRAPVAEAVAGRDRVLLVASHYRSDLQELNRIVRSQGFRTVERRERPGARLYIYERTDS